MSDSYLEWREKLYVDTSAVLQAAARDGSDLTKLPRVFHYLRDSKLGSALLQQIKDGGGKVPADWPCRGTFPGIWCALKDPHNTYSMAAGTLFIVELTFVPGYRVFDPMNKAHMALWGAWASSVDKTEKKLDVEEWPVSMQHKMRGGMLWPAMPHKLAFYKAHHFGAVVGYSDYMSLVVMLPEAVATVIRVV